MELIKLDGLRTLMMREGPVYFFEDFHLGSTFVVVEANSVAKKIYETMPNRHDCFAGNYDCYIREVQKYMSKLLEVNVKPFVIFFGGSFRHTIHHRAAIGTAMLKGLYVGPHSDNDLIVYPLWLRDAFMDVIEDMEIKKVQLDFIDYISPVVIAKFFDIPILAEDPNFYLWNVKYIPLRHMSTRIEQTLTLDQSTKQRKLFRFLKCKVYNIEILLKYLGLRNAKHLLPVYAALMQYDNFHDDRGFKSLFQKIGLRPRCSIPLYKEFFTNWIRNADQEILRSNLEKISDDCSRKYIWENVQKVVKSYNPNVSEYLRYVGIHVINIPPQLEVPTEPLTDVLTGVPAVFTYQYRSGLFSPNFVDLIHLRLYYLKRQVEHLKLSDSHDVSFTMIRAIFKILTGANSSFTCFMRHQDAIMEIKLASYRLELPSLLQIHEMSLEERRRSLTDIIVFIDVDKYKKCLDSVPESWKVFVAALKVYLNYKKNWPLIYSLIMCKLILSRIDALLGYIRSRSTLNHRFSKVLQEYRPVPAQSLEPKTVKDKLKKITEGEAAKLMETFIDYFKMRGELREHPERFDRQIVHQLGQFQSCLMHVKYLNDIFNCPYEKCEIGETINGTFIYNLTSKILRSRASFYYLFVMLYKTPMVYGAVKILVDQLEDCSKIIL